jgi:hypothetical protein
MAVVGALPLVEVAHVWANPIGWLMRGGRPLIGGGLGSKRSLEKGHCLQNTHTRGHESQKMRPVWVKRGLYWLITRFRARGEYMIRLDWLNK